MKNLFLEGLETKSPLFHNRQLLSGWWFGCHQFYFPRNIGFLIIPIDELIFFGGVALAHQPVVIFGSNLFGSQWQLRPTSETSDRGHRHLGWRLDSVVGPLKKMTRKTWWVTRRGWRGSWWPLWNIEISIIYLLYIDYISTIIPSDIGVIHQLRQVWATLLYVISSYSGIFSCNNRTETFWGVNVDRALRNQ